MLSFMTTPPLAATGCRTVAAGPGTPRPGPSGRLERLRLPALGALAPLPLGGEGELRTVERTDVLAVVEEDPVADPAEPVDQGHPARSAGGDAGEVLGGDHLVVDPQLVTTSLLEHRRTPYQRRRRGQEPAQGTGEGSGPGHGRTLRSVRSRGRGSGWSRSDPSTTAEGSSPAAARIRRPSSQRDIASGPGRCQTPARSERSRPTSDQIARARSTARIGLRTSSANSVGGVPARTASSSQPVPRSGGSSDTTSDVRVMQASGTSSRTPCSAASFQRPYALTGPTGSPSE